MKVYLISTSTAEYLVGNILSKSKNFKVIFPLKNRARERCFPDGEVYMRLPSIPLLGKGGVENHKKRVIVLHSGAPKPNEGLVELELILQILKDKKIKPELFFTYFPYGMQDEVFKKGETNAVKNLIEKFIYYYQVKKIYTIDAHFWKRDWVKKYPLINASAVPILIKKAKENFGKNVLFLSPDIGGERRTKFLGMKKKRLDSFRVKIFSAKLNLEGKIVAVIDDMIKTGGTLLKFYQIAKRSRAKTVIALVTHGVLPLGVSKIKKKYSKLYLTNTIKQKESNVDITDLILENISKL